MAKRSVLNLNQVGTHRDFGDGAAKRLYLQVRMGADGELTRSWLYRFVSPTTGKPSWKGLGSARDVSLAKARQMARDNYDLLAKGIDPNHPAPGRKAFGEAAKEFLKKAAGDWTNDRHAEQWQDTFVDRIRSDGSKVPAITALLNPIGCDQIDKRLVLDVLEKLSDTPSTLHRTRGRIEQVLSYAAAKGYRDENVVNPASWELLKHAKLPKLERDSHHPAMPVKAIPAFMRKLRNERSLSCRALEFLILCAARTGEVRGATWSEINEGEATWTIPADRMKAKVEHVVPLSGRALEILRQLPQEGEYLFPGAAGPGLSKNAIDIALKAMDSTVTTHGFRSSFRDFAGDYTDHDRETIEFALAHKLPDAVEASYRRTKALEKRRRLMDQWCAYCGGASMGGNVVKLRA